MTDGEVDEGTAFMRYKLFCTFKDHTLSVIKCVRSWLQETDIGCWEVRLQHLLCLYDVSEIVHSNYCRSTSYEDFVHEGLRFEYVVTVEQCTCCTHVVVQRVDAIVLEPPLTTIENRKTADIYDANVLQNGVCQLNEYSVSVNDCHLYWLYKQCVCGAREVTVR